MKATTRFYTLLMVTLATCASVTVFAQPLPRPPEGKEEKLQLLLYMNQLEDCIKADNVQTPDCRDEYEHIRKIYDDLNQQRMFLDPLVIPTQPVK